MDVTDEIKMRVDLVDYINTSVQLKKAGKNYKGLCPFHSEKTPSFVVFPGTSTWRCFGCGRGGDVFNFAMEHEGLDFRGALEHLASIAGVTLEPLTPQQQERQEATDRLLDLLAEVTGFYLETFLHQPEAQHARDYIGGRGLTEETVADFEIGYAPDGWQTTSDHLLEMGYAQDDLIDAGLLVVNDRGHTYDRFRNRIMIPIRDARGRVVGFGARTLDPDGKPKYLNSPQNALFDKSALLYGFAMGRRAIRETETAIIVEGYMDVIQAHQAGFTNVVAQMGTALTERQLKLLARYASRIILALDADAAGQMATDRGLEAIERVSQSAAEQATEEGIWDFDAAERDFRAKRTMEFDPSGMVRYENDLGFDIRVVVMPVGKDPDDLIRHDQELWADLINDSTPIVEYAINKAVEGRNIDDPKVKSAIVNELTPLINNVASAVERSHYRQKLARLLRISESALMQRPPSRPAREQTTKRSEPRPPEPEPNTQVNLATPTASREAFCLAALLRDQRLIYKVNRVLSQYFALEDNLPSEQYAIAQETVPHLLARRVSPYDFQKTIHRMIFVAWEEALNQAAFDRMDYLRERLHTDTWQHVSIWLDQPIYALRPGTIPKEGRLTEESIFNEVVRGVLMLRGKRLESHQQELVLYLQDMDNGGNSAALRDNLIIVNAIRAAKQNILKAHQAFSLAAKLET